MQRFAVDQQTRLAIAAHGLTLTATLCQLAAQPLQALRSGCEADAHTGASGVQYVNSLIRQLTTRQVTSGQLGSGDYRVITQIDTVTLLVDLSQATKDSHRLADGGFMQLHWLESTRQCRVFLKVLFVLGPGSRRDGA